MGSAGDTTSFVFRGKVKVQAVGDESSSGFVLRANESARVEKDSKTGETRILSGLEIGAVPKFARRIYEPPKFLDLLDIVAGGNGLGKRREEGINPVDGSADLQPVGVGRRGDGRYWPVRRHRFIDGVFVPDGRNGKVVLDSAGHTFDAFPETTGGTWGSLWSRAADIRRKDLAQDSSFWIYEVGEAREFMPEGRGLLAMCSNAGITFDLDGIRQVFRGSHPTRFQATVGLVDSSHISPRPDSLVDLWIFIDGRLILKRLGIRRRDGQIKLNIELSPVDRFLTLATTDGGDGTTSDCFVLGDPVLVLSSVETESRPMKH